MGRDRSPPRRNSPGRGYRGMDRRRSRSPPRPRGRSPRRKSPPPRRRSYSRSPPRYSPPLRHLSPPRHSPPPYRRHSPPGYVHNIPKPPPPPPAHYADFNRRRRSPSPVTAYRQRSPPAPHLPVQSRAPMPYRSSHLQRPEDDPNNISVRSPRGHYNPAPFDNRARQHSPRRPQHDTRRSISPPRRHYQRSPSPPRRSSPPRQQQYAAPRNPRSPGLVVEKRRQSPPRPAYIDNRRPRSPGLVIEKRRRSPPPPQPAAAAINDYRKRQRPATSPPVVVEKRKSRSRSPPVRERADIDRRPSQHDRGQSNNERRDVSGTSAATRGNDARPQQQQQPPKQSNGSSAPPRDQRDRNNQAQRPSEDTKKDKPITDDKASNKQPAADRPTAPAAVNNGPPSPRTVRALPVEKASPREAIELADDDSNCWYYLDPSNEVQGPYSVNQLWKWLQFFRSTTDERHKESGKQFAEITVCKASWTRRITLKSLLSGLPNYKD